MASPDATRHASGARGGARRRVPAVIIDPAAVPRIATVPRFNGDTAYAARRFAESAYGPCRDTPIPHEYCTPVLYRHDGSGFRVASPQQIIAHAQHLISERFHRNDPLINRPEIVRAILQMQLAAHRHVVFAAFFLTGQHRLIAFVELFNGDMVEVTVPRGEFVREALQRNARAVIAARNEPSGEPAMTLRETRTARDLGEALSLVDVKLLDYLIVGENRVDGGAAHLVSG
jgi:DNA repair protein RadC